MNTLSAHAQAVLDRLTTPAIDPDETMALLIPFGLPAGERALLLDYFTAVVRELRDAGWNVRVQVFRKHDGEAHTLSIEEEPVAQRRPAA